MICEACHGQQTYPPCPECGGCGIGHCCDGLIECPSSDTEMPSNQRGLDRFRFSGRKPSKPFSIRTPGHRPD
jgi:hypothetical protein